MSTLAGLKSYFNVWNDVRGFGVLNVEPSLSSRTSLPKFSLWSIVCFVKRVSIGDWRLRCHTNFVLQTVFGPITRHSMTSDHTKLVFGVGVLGQFEHPRQCVAYAGKMSFDGYLFSYFGRWNLFKTSLYSHLHDASVCSASTINSIWNCRENDTLSNRWLSRKCSHNLIFHWIICKIATHSHTQTSVSHTRYEWKHPSDQCAANE